MGGEPAPRLSCPGAERRGRSSVSESPLVAERSDAREYFTAIEQHFGRLRRRPLLLAPRDVALVKQWHEADIPLRVVVRALERFFEREARRATPRRQPTSLAFVVEDVYALWDEWQAVHRGDRDLQPKGGSQADLARDHLATSAGRLELAMAAAKARGADKLRRALRRARDAVRELDSQLDELPIGVVEERLAEAEAKVLKAARSELGEDDHDELRRQARARLDSLPGDFDEKAFRVLLRKAEERALRERFDVPRIALFSF